MTLVQDFRSALAASAVALPDPELLPERLARACAGVLPVDGAGISLFFADERRLPVGASDPVAAEAERLQFTVGEGPCLTSHATGEPVVAGEATLRSRWPGYFDVAGLLRRPGHPHADTGHISLPLRGRAAGHRRAGPVRRRSARRRPVEPSRRPVRQHEVTAELHAPTRGSRTSSDGPAWLDAPAAQRRSTVWQAIGFVNSALGIPSPDALALLRAHAFAGGRSLDELAALVIGRQVAVEELALDSDSTRWR